MISTMKIQKLQKLSIQLIFFYLSFAVLLFFLMGEQLHFRESRGNIVSITAEKDTTELVNEFLVEQEFTLTMQEIQEISVQWGSYHRENRGSAVVELWNMSNSTLLLSEILDMSSLVEGEFTFFEIDVVKEPMFETDLLLKIYSLDGETGFSATPLMGFENSVGTLSINGEPVEGTLCFSVTGVDEIWFGSHYWDFVTIGGVFLFIILSYSLWLSSVGKKNYFMDFLCSIDRYHFLIRQLVARDFRGKYKRSVLGVFWSFLNPLLTMTVQYIVFSELFRFDIENYPVYLICGIILFGFFTESCNMTLMSITGNASLITKVYVPKIVYPFTRTISSLVNLLISLIPLFAVSLFSGVLPTKAVFLLPYPLFCLTLFSFGSGLILCTFNVFFRDTQFLWGIFTMILMYLTPIFYPAEILPEKYAWVLDVNPLYYFIEFVRKLVMEGISPEPVVYVQCFIAGLLPLLLGFFVFKRNQDKFVLYI